MDWLPILADSEMSEDQKKTFERALTKFEIPQESAPDWLRVLANSPEFLKDTYMNVSRAILADGALSAMMKLTIATAVASHAGARGVAATFAQKALAHGATPERLIEAAGIAATSTSFNFYYKFRSLYQGDEFNGYNPGLRASLFVTPSQGKAFAELVNLVLSTINGCKSCVNGHVADALGAEVTREQIDEALRTGAIVMSICTFVS